MIENCEKLAEQRYPERPINLPEGQAVVVPIPERKAFVRGAAWAASQPLSPSAGTRHLTLDEQAVLHKARSAGATYQYALSPSERGEVLAVLEPFAREADAVSLSDALGHIERAHLMAARDLVAQLLRAEEPTDDA